jgi:hypothetical protein
MKVSRTFFAALVLMAFVLASVSGCERRPRPYAGFKEDKTAQQPIDPHSQNK